VDVAVAPEAVVPVPPDVAVPEALVVVAPPAEAAVVADVAADELSSSSSPHALATSALIATNDATASHVFLRPAMVSPLCGRSANLR
jgi:hypothetical protein